jgi:hypothetical protein
MAYAEKYKFEWRSPMREQLLYRVSILEDGYSGSANTLYPTGDCITITQGGRDDRELEPIRASEAEISLLCVGIDELYSEFYALDPLRYKVVVREEREQGTYIKWVGYLSTGSYSQPYAKPPYTVTLKANDGIAALKTFTYAADDGSLHRGKRSVKGLLEYLLTPLGMSVEVWGYDAVSPRGGYDSSLDNIYISDESIYLAYDFEAPTYYDVLSDLLSTFGLTLFQSQGRWVVRSFAALGLSTRPAGWQPLHARYSNYGDTLPILGNAEEGEGMSAAAELSFLSPLRELSVQRDNSQGDAPLTTMRDPNRWYVKSVKEKKRQGKTGVRIMLDTRRAPENIVPMGGLFLGYAAYSLDYAMQPCPSMELGLNIDVHNLANPEEGGFHSFYMAVLAVPATIDPLTWLETVANNINFVDRMPDDIWVWSPDSPYDESISTTEQWVSIKTNSILDIFRYSKKYDLQQPDRKMSFYTRYSERAMVTDNVSMSVVGIPGAAERYNLVVLVSGAANQYTINQGPQGWRFYSAFELGDPQISMSTDSGITPHDNREQITMAPMGLDTESYSQTFYEGTAQPISPAFFLPSILDKNDVPVIGFVNTSSGAMLVDSIATKLAVMRYAVTRQLDGEVYVKAPIDLNTLWHDTDGRIYYTNYIRHLMRRGLCEVQLREMLPLAQPTSLNVSAYGIPDQVVGLDTALFFVPVSGGALYRISTVDSTIRALHSSGGTLRIAKGNGCCCLIEEVAETSVSYTYNLYAYDDSGKLLSYVEDLYDAVSAPTSGTTVDKRNYARSARFDIYTMTWILANTDTTAGKIMMAMLDDGGGLIIEQTTDGRMVGGVNMMTNGFTIQAYATISGQTVTQTWWHSNAYHNELDYEILTDFSSPEAVAMSNDIYIVSYDPSSDAVNIYARESSKMDCDTSSPLYTGVSHSVVALNSALVLMRNNLGVAVVYDGRVGQAFEIPNSTISDTLALVGDTVLVISGSAIARYRIFGAQAESVATPLMTRLGEAVTDASGRVVMVRATATSGDSYQSRYTGEQMDTLFAKANTAYQLPQGGIPMDDLSDEVKNAIAAGGGGGGSLNSVDIAVDSSSSSYIKFTHEGTDDGLQEYTVKVLTKGIDDNGDGVATAKDIRTLLAKRFSAKIIK